MICPSCNTSDPAVYVGFSSIDCTNQRCKHYSSSGGEWSMEGAAFIYPISDGHYISVLRLASLDENDRWGAFLFEEQVDTASSVAQTPERALEMLVQSADYHIPLTLLPPLPKR